MKDKVKIKLEEIVKCIVDGIENDAIEKTIGLYNGKFGILLFLYYYSYYSGDKKMRSFADNFAEKIVDDLWTERIPTFCSGLSGVLYLFEFLREQQFIDIDLENADAEFDNYLIHCMERFMEEIYYDFMHGALGIGLYFMKKGDNIEPVLKLIDFLYDTAEKDFDNMVFKWKSVIQIEEGTIGYNIALSHGIASIVLFLSRAVSSRIEHNKLLALLEGAVNYMLSQGIDVEKYGSYFPPQSLENENSFIGKSRLGWCYGDLGIAYSIWYAGKAIDKKDWINLGMNILLNSIERKDTNTNFVSDAGLCHGSAGIAMVYNRLFLETANPVFLEASHYWIKQTLMFATYADGLAGYKSYQGQHKESECDYNLLTGISGIGLMLLSYLLNDKQKWDEMFLLY